MHPYRRLLGYLRPYIATLIAAALLLALSGALMGAVVSTVKPLVNDVLLSGTAHPAARPSASSGPDFVRELRAWIPTERIGAWVREHAFVEIPLILVLIFGIRGVIGYFGQYATIKAGVCMVRDLRLDLYRSVTYQPLGFYQRNTTGTIVSRILNDIARLQRTLTKSLADGVRVGTMVPTLILIAVYHEWRMSLFAIVALPLLGYPMVRLGKRLRRASIASQVHMADVAHKITESVGGVKVVQGFGMERYEIERFNGALTNMLRADLKAGRASALGPSIMELFAAGIGAGLFYLAGRSIAQQSLDPGNFSVVLFCMGLLFISIRRLNTVYVDFQQALAAAERVFDMLDRQPEIRDAPDARALVPFRREIRFRDVHFDYGDGTVLHEIDQVIRSGEVVALVGASGSGKSTLANLLPRFYDPTAGRIEFDGIDIRQATLVSLREQIGIVTQETVLFDDTVRNNIAYGRSEVTLERIREVARATQAHEFIEQLPRGYDTVLGERGARLSMGQRQRLTIARALLKDPPLLILDEATSALDTESESQVQAALEVLMRGRTSIVIAHRLATVRRADRILVLDAGRIVEQGDHATLLERGGAYARLYELQFREHPS